jgi:hypothetical protein
MNNRPNLPRSLTCREKIILYLVSNGSKGISIHKTKVGEEHSHEDGTPKDLVNSNLECNILGSSSLDLAIQPVVEVMSRRTMVEKSKGRKSNESFHIESSFGDENLKREKCKSKEKGRKRKNGELRDFLCIGVIHHHDPVSFGYDVCVFVFHCFSSPLTFSYLC